MYIYLYIYVYIYIYTLFFSSPDSFPTANEKLALECCLSFVAFLTIFSLELVALDSNEFELLPWSYL